MKVIAINGSPRKEGNTETILNIIKEEFSKENIEMEIINIGADNIHGCISCWYCMEKQECIFKDDKVNETVKKIIEADGFILAAPTYYGGIPGTMKSFLDRLFFRDGKIQKQNCYCCIHCSSCRRNRYTSSAFEFSSSFRSYYPSLTILDKYLWNGKRRNS